MGWVEVWGWVCAVAGMLAALPQVVRLLRLGTSAGLSTLLWQLNAGAGIGWIVHGVVGGHLNLVVPNVVITATNVLVLALIQRDRRLAFSAVWPLGLVVTLACVVVEFTLPAGAFGLVVLVPHAIGMLGQLRDLLRSADVSGVSPAFLGAAAAIQFLWFSWGLAVGDVSVLLCAGVLAVIASVNVGVYLHRRPGVTSAAAAPADGPADLLVPARPPSPAAGAAARCAPA